MNFIILSCCPPKRIIFSYKETLPFVDNLKPEYFLKGRDAQKEEYGADIQNLNADENTEIHVFGLCYDYCVKSTADIMKQRYPKAKVKILKSLTVAINPDWVYQGDCIVIE